MPKALGIDASTQSCSAIVIDTDNSMVVAEASVNFGEKLPEYSSPSGFLNSEEEGVVHANPLMWLDALELLLKDLGAQCDLSDIQAVSGAGQQHGSVYLNSKWFDALSSLRSSGSLSAQLEPCFSRSTAPIWMDSSTTVQCDEISQAVGGNDKVCATSGSIITERFSGSQIRKFYQNAPESYSSTERIHLVSSFLCSVLCGADVAIDTGDAAGMNLLSLESWDWDTDLVKATAPELQLKLPAVVQGKTVVGSVASYFVEKYGFSADTPVTVFTGDNPSSLVGMAASQAGKVVISLGTSDTFFASIPEVKTDPQGFGHVFGNPEGGAMSLQCFANGSLAREAVKDKFGYDWDDFTKALDDTPVGNGGNLMLPFFFPEISPRVNTTGPILKGSSEFKQWELASHAVRSCVEGQALSMKIHTEWMGLSPDTLYLTGGASRNDSIAQVFANVFNTKVERLTVSGSVSLGAAMRAANVSFGVSMKQLESDFCSADSGRSILPEPFDHNFDESTKDLSYLLAELQS